MLFRRSKPYCFLPFSLPSWSSSLKIHKGDVTRDDLQRRFLAQHSVAMLKQCCSYSKQCCNNVAAIRKNVATMLQRCVALKIVVANLLVKLLFSSCRCALITLSSFHPGVYQSLLRIIFINLIGFMNLASR